MKEQIKELRVKIDGLSQLVKELNFKSFIDQINNNKPSHELNKCYDSLILAKAWLGKVLGELGEPTPYANDGNRKTVKDIEPTADTHFEINQKHIFGKEQGLISEEYLNFNHIEKVDWLRQEIQHITYVVYQICVTNSKTRFHSETCYRHLCEARFWLGFELGRIKESGATRNNI